PRELSDAVDAALVLGLERERAHRGELGVRRRADIVVEAVDEDPAVPVYQGLQYVDEAPRRVREIRRAARVRVADHRPHAQLDVVDALAAEQQVRPAGGVDPAALLQRAITVGERRVLREQLRQVRAAVLLLTFDEEAQPDREL